MKKALQRYSVGPQQDIERRFARSLRNLLMEFSYAVNRCSCFMNTNDQTTLIFEQQGEQRNVIRYFFINIF